MLYKRLWWSGAESSEPCGLVKCCPNLGVQVRKSPCHCMDYVPHELKPNKICMCYKHMDSCKKYLFLNSMLSLFLCMYCRAAEAICLCKIVLYKFSSCLCWHIEHQESVFIFLSTALCLSHNEILLSHLSLNLFCCSNSTLCYLPWKPGKLAFLLSFAACNVEIVSITVVSVLLVTPCSTLKLGNQFLLGWWDVSTQAKAAFVTGLGDKTVVNFPC